MFNKHDSTTNRSCDSVFNIILYDLILTRNIVEFFKIIGLTVGLLVVE